jgi:hypothetical protein
MSVTRRQNASQASPQPSFQRLLLSAIGALNLRAFDWHQFKRRSKNIVYVDYDVVCLLTSQCREITFQLNTAIPLERVLAIASSFRADKLPPRLLQRLLLTFDTRDRALNRSVERAALASPPQEDVDQVTFAQLARDHDLSLSEFEELYRQAARLLMEGFQRRQTHALPSSVIQQATARPSSRGATMPSTLFESRFDCLRRKTPDAQSRLFRIESRFDALQKAHCVKSVVL